VDHPIVSLFAYQEALLIEAVFGVTLLVMAWVGFRRWLQHKERLGQLIAEQTAECAAQHGAQIKRVEARLKSIEQLVGESDFGTAAEIEAAGTSLPAEPIASGDEL